MKRVARAPGVPVEVPIARELEPFWEVYTAQTRFQDLGVESARCREIMEASGDRSFRGMFQAMLLAYRERAGKVRVGEKTPSHVHYIGHLLDWFPDARILVLQRDPRAVTASQLRSIWVQRRLTPFTVRHGLLVGKRIHQVAYYAQDWWRVHQRTLPPWEDDARVRTVSYEALVTEPEAEVRQICAFLGEAFEPQMLQESERRDIPAPANDRWDDDWSAWREEHHARARQAITTSSLDKWKEELQPMEVALVEGRCERGMQKAGYAFSTGRAGRLVGRSANRLLLATEHVEDRGRRIAKALLRPVRDRLRAAVAGAKG